MQIDEPVYNEPPLLDVPPWRHPLSKADMPRFPLMEDLELDRADLEMDPIPKLELAWEVRERAGRLGLCKVWCVRKPD